MDHSKSYSEAKKEVALSSLLIKCFVGESAAKYVKPRSGNAGILFICRVSATQGWRIWTARSPNDFFNGLLSTVYL